MSFSNLKIIGRPVQGIIVLIGFLFLLAFAPALYAATYYVDATLGKDANAGLSEVTAWKTIAKVNASRFVPGDQILFKKGETWREQLTVPSSGSAGNPITFGAYGAGNSPTINGADVISGWSVYRGTTFMASSLTIQPNQVFMDSMRLTKGSSPDTLNNQEWFWTGGALYFRNDAGYPIAGGKLVEASQRDYCVLLDYPGVKNFIVIDSLSMEKANEFGLYVGSALSGFTVSNSVIQSCYYDGLKATCGARQNNGLIQGNTMRFNGRAGVVISGLAKTWAIDGNKFHDNCQLNDPNHDFCGGIYIWGNNDKAPNSITNIAIQSNEVYRNGIVSPTANRGAGIWLDDCGGGNIVRYNTVHNNNSNGILLEATSATEVYYNLVYANNGANQRLGGIYIKGNGGRTASNNLVFNNTVYGNWAGIAVATYDASAETTGQAANNVIINNISVGNVQELFAYLGGANNGINGAGNVYRYNCFGPERPAFIRWGQSEYSSYGSWESAYGGPTYSVRANPQLVNPDLGNFKLQSSSPCINTGTNVGLARDYAGIAVPQGNGVDIGALEFVPTTWTDPPRNLRIYQAQ